MSEKIVTNHFTLRERFEDPAFRRATRFQFTSHFAYMVARLIDRSLLYDPSATRIAIEDYFLAMDHASKGEATDADRDSIALLLSDDASPGSGVHELPAQGLPEYFRWITAAEAKSISDLKYVLKILGNVSPRFEEFIFLSAAVAEDLQEIAEKIQTVAPYHRSPQYRDRRDLMKLRFPQRVRHYINDWKNSRQSYALYGKLLPLINFELLGEAVYLNKIDEDFQRAFIEELTEIMALRDKILNSMVKRGYGDYFEMKLSESHEVQHVYDEIVTIDKLNS